MDNELISVIIPVYNVEKYLRKCLDSIIHQTYKNLEIIIIDDGSTDNSGKICDEYARKDRRIKVIHQKNGEISAARNTGLKMISGDYVGYVDSDDYIAVDMYEKLYKALVKSNSDLSVCNWYIGQKNGERKINTKFPKNKILTKNEILEDFYGDMYVRNKLYKRNLIENFYFKGSFGEDFGYNFQVISKLKKVICINDCKYFYRYNNQSKLHIKNFKEEYLCYIDFLDMGIKYCEENGLYKLKKNLINKRTGIASARLYYLSFENKPNKKTINFLSKIVKKNIFQYLLSDTKISKKFFATIVCTSFYIAKNLSKLLKIFC